MAYDPRNVPPITSFSFGNAGIHWRIMLVVSQ
jgi:hypothetical protein